MDLVDIGDSLPSIISTTIAMIFMSIATLFVANKAGIGEISDRVERANEALVKRQSETIQLLEKRVASLEIELAETRTAYLQAQKRLDELEEYIINEKIKAAHISFDIKGKRD